MADIIATNPARDWNPKKLAEAMVENPLVKQAQPSYSYAQAKRDWNMLTHEFAKKRDDLVDHYLSVQLEVSDQMADDLLNQWDQLVGEEIDYESDVPPLVQQSARIRSMGVLSQAMERLMKRQSTLLPIEVPKQIEVREQRINLDMFLEAKLKHQKKLEAMPQHSLEEENVLEGEFVEKE